MMTTSGWPRPRVRLEDIVSEQRQRNAAAIRSNNPQTAQVARKAPRKCTKVT